MTTVEFDFEELQPVIEGCRIEGMMLYGKAVLESSHEFEAHEFFVVSIELDAEHGKRYVLPHPGSAHNSDPFKAKLFKAIASRIENDRTDLGKAAQAMFSCAVDDESEPDADRAYDERRDRQATSDVPMFKPRPGLSDAGVPV